ncbi:hypothetical protein [Rossellomorea marisflavi]|uniref:hypothetical protein n=1 Tax=Rossellomorea marisflavi TaxID=189381 RepID=UPI00345D70BD
MLFLTLFFIFTYGLALVKGRLFHETIVEEVKLSIKKANEPEYSYPTEFSLRFIGVALYLVILTIILAVYLIKAISIDPFLYPTLSIIVVHFIGFISGNLLNKKYDLTDPKQASVKLSKAEKRHSVRRSVFNLIETSYFIYMFLVLIELIK